MKRAVSRPLDEIRLTGGRAAARRMTVGVLLGLAGIAIGLVLAEQHHADGQRWHSVIGETAYGPLIMMVIATAVGGVALRWPSMVSGISAGMVASFAAVVALAWWKSPHPSEALNINAAGAAAPVFIMLIVPVGLALIALELLMHIRERRHLAASDPEFPAARVIR